MQLIDTLSSLLEHASSDLLTICYYHVLIPAIGQHLVA
jgi:hypothetical protein